MTPITRARLVLTACLLLAGLPPPAAAQTRDRLTLCAAKALTPLVSLAGVRNFYAAEGLDVELKHFQSGRQALEAMFIGQCQLANAAEIPVAHHSLTRRDFSIVATLHTSTNFVRLVVRGDRGIRTAADLRGRSVAVPRLTVAHYYLEMVLLTNGLSPQDVKQVHLAPQELVKAFRAGEVDAAAYWEPDVRRLAQAFEPNAALLSAPGLHVIPFMLLGPRDYLAKNPETVKRVLRALLRAERHLREQPAAARTQVAAAFGIDPAEVDLVWSLLDIGMTLNQALLFTLENSARWLVGQLPAGERPAVPDYLDFLYPDALLAVKPAAVTIIR